MINSFLSAVAICLLPGLVLSQEYNPYQSLHKKAHIQSSSGKFIETFDTDSVQRIGSILFNTRTRKIVRFLASSLLDREGRDNTISSRWFSQDPLATKYPSFSPYAFVENNPIRYTDPDGREVVGATKNDAKKARTDIQGMFKGDQFAGIRSLIKLDKGGKTFSKIDGKALDDATKGLNADEKQLVNMMVNTINSNDIHKIAYVSITDNLSEEASNAINKAAHGTLQSSLDANGGVMSGDLAARLGGTGITVRTEDGSYSVIITGQGPEASGKDYYNADTKTMGNNPAGEPATIGHELLGHGRSLVLGRKETQQSDAIQTENLILRVMGYGNIQRDGTGHGTFVKVENPSDPPGYQ